MNSQEYRKMYVSGPKKDPRRQLQGAINRAQGGAFENAIEASCIYYKIKKRAFIEKTPEPMKILRRLLDGFLCCFLKPAQPDYKGTLAGGRAICFEAKNTEADKIPESRVTPAQKDALDNHLELGAACFVVISLGMQNFYRVPWKDWRSMKERLGRKYMNASDLEPYRLKFESGVIKFLD